MTPERPIQTGRLLLLGDLQIDVRGHQVLGRGEAGRLTPKSLAVLLQLASSPGQMCTRMELLDRLWPDSAPTPDALSHAVRELRRALGDSARTPRIVETVHGVGYRLKPAVEWRDDATPLEPKREQDAPAPQEAPPASRRVPFAAAVLLVLLLGLGALSLVLWREESAAPAPATGWVEGSLITSEPGAEEFPSLSPDGSLVAYTVRRTPGDRFDLEVRSVVGGKGMALTATPDVDEVMPVWSPDGAWIAYLRIEGDSCAIERLPATGGAAQRLSGCDRVVFGSLDWAVDGSHLIAALPAGPGSEPRLHRIDAGGAGATPIPYALDAPGWDRDPALSPDGRWIAFRRGVPPDYDLFVLPAQGGAARRLTRSGRVGEGMVWSNDGGSVVVAIGHAGQSSLHAIDVATGDARPLGIENATRPHIAGDRMVFQRQRLHVQMLALPLHEREGEAADILAGSTGSVRMLASSPQRDRIVYLSDRGGSEQLWLESPQAAPRVFPHPAEYRITSMDWNDAGDAVLVVWSGADADRLVRLELASGRYTETGLERPLLRDVVHGASDDHVYAILRKQERPVISRIERNEAGQWAEVHSEATATELVRVPGVPGVFGRTPMQPDRVVHVRDDLSARFIPLQPRVFGWTAWGQGIAYVTAARRAEPVLRHYDLETGSDEALRPLPAHFPRRRAAVGVYGDRIVLGLVVDDNTDVGQARLQGPAG